MTDECKGEGGVYVSPINNKTSCYCPDPKKVNETAYTALVLFCISLLAFWTAFIMYIFIKTVVEGKRQKRTLRRQSEALSSHYDPYRPRYSRRVSQFDKSNVQMVRSSSMNSTQGAAIASNEEDFSSIYDTLPEEYTVMPSSAAVLNPIAEGSEDEDLEANLKLSGRRCTYQPPATAPPRISQQFISGRDRHSSLFGGQHHYVARADSTSSNQEVDNLHKYLFGPHLPSPKFGLEPPPPPQTTKRKNSFNLKKIRNSIRPKGDEPDEACDAPDALVEVVDEAAGSTAAQKKYSEPPRKRNSFKALSTTWRKASEPPGATSASAPATADDVAARIQVRRKPRRYNASLKRLHEEGQQQQKQQKQRRPPAKSASFAQSTAPARRIGMILQEAQKKRSRSDIFSFDSELEDEQESHL